MISITDTLDSSIPKKGSTTFFPTHGKTCVYICPSIHRYYGSGDYLPLAKSTARYLDASLPAERLIVFFR